MIKKAFIGASIFACLFLSGQQADASLILGLYDYNTGTSVIVIDDSLAGTLSDTTFWTSTIADNNATAGVVGFSGAVGTFTVNVSTGLSKPVLKPNTLDLNSVNVSGAAGRLGLFLIDTGYFDNGYTFRSEIGGTTDGTVDFISAIDPTNGELAFGPLAFAFGLTSPFAFVSNDSGPALGPGPYSMALFVDLYHSGGSAVSSFDAHLAQIPEPGTIAIWSVLGALGFVGVKRRRNL